MVEKINHSRASDHNMMDSFQQELIEKVQMHRMSQRSQETLLILKEIDILRLLTHPVFYHFVSCPFRCSALADGLIISPAPGERDVPADEGAHVHGL